MENKKFLLHLIAILLAVYLMVGFRIYWMREAMRIEINNPCLIGFRSNGSSVQVCRSFATQDVPDLYTDKDYYRDQHHIYWRNR